jgi:hypothetical protein
MNVESIDLLDSDTPTDTFIDIQKANWAVGVKGSGLMRGFKQVFNAANWGLAFEEQGRCGPSPALGRNVGGAGA